VLPEINVAIGYDPREDLAWRVARASLLAHTPPRLQVWQFTLDAVREAGVYKRPTKKRAGQLFDVISNAPMSTEHALLRFWIPWAFKSGRALFVDGDVLFRADARQLFAAANPRHAVSVVKHAQPAGLATKMDGQVQSDYPRKNWSSVCLWNLDHPAHARLTLHEMNTRPGLWLHQFGWLRDEEIGELPASWNHLVGVNEMVSRSAVKLAHFTLGTPDMAACADQPFADEWSEVARRASGQRGEVA
jgi:hypothetical protein